MSVLENVARDTGIPRSHVEAWVESVAKRARRHVDAGEPIAVAVNLGHNELQDMLAEMATMQTERARAFAAESAEHTYHAIRREHTP